MLNNVNLVKNLIKCRIQLGLTVSFCKNEIEIENHLFNYYKLDICIIGCTEISSP